MKLLALESSCERASVALLSDDEICMHWLDGHASHSEHILTTVRALLDEAGLAVGGLDAVAFGAGPGAFTGLRLACGVAQGLALGAGLGVIPVCSLAAIAARFSSPPETPAWVWVATDARMGEIYHARYRIDADGAVTECQPPACAAPAALSCPPGVWHGLGSAFAAHESALATVRARLASCDPQALPSAAAVARLAARLGAARIVSAESAVPLYVRDKVALTTDERLARGKRA
jgi:tRNA threonylcarbamoyladenosine biosynthesis protein TsaB